MPKTQPENVDYLRWFVDIRRWFHLSASIHRDWMEKYPEKSSTNYQWQFSEWTWVQSHNETKIKKFCSIVENSEGVNGVTMRITRSKDESLKFNTVCQRTRYWYSLRVSWDRLFPNFFRKRIYRLLVVYSSILILFLLVYQSGGVITESEKIGFISPRTTK